MPRYKKHYGPAIDAEWENLSEPNNAVEPYRPKSVEPFKPRSFSEALKAMFSPGGELQIHHEVNLQQIYNDRERTIAQIWTGEAIDHANIERHRSGTLAQMNANKEMRQKDKQDNKEEVQQDIRDHYDVALTEYQEALRFESQKKESRAKQTQVDSVKLRRQLREVEERGLSPQDEEMEKERIIAAWEGATDEYAENHHHQKDYAEYEE